MNDKIFKIDDYVILLDGAGIHILEMFKSYKVVDIKFNYNTDQLIALEGIENDEDDYQKYPYFNSKRFTSDIKPIRRAKLNKIFNETN